MPALIVAVAGSVAGAAAATALGFVAGTLAYAVTSAVTSVVVSSALGSLFSSGSSQQQQQQQQDIAYAERGLLLNTASTDDALPVIYGSRRIGGVRCLAEVSGSNNAYLNLVIAHCEGPVSAINTVYIDGVPSDDAKFSGLVTVEKHLGALDQVASAALVAELPGIWTSAHKGSGIAYTYIRLKYDQNVFRGIPIITADIDGRTLFDVRDSSTAFSHNPALAVYDYLTNSLYGRGIPSASLDSDSFIAAANVCDITYTDPLDVVRKQHTCNGVVNTNQNSIENVKLLLTSCRGTLLFSARGYGLIVDKAETPTTFEFNEDNIVGSWTIGSGSKRTRFNRVRGNWYNPDREWQPDIWPADSPTFRALDNGLLLEDQLELPFTSCIYEAQMKSERHLRQSRFDKTLSFVATIAGMDCEVGDVVPVTHSTPGYASKPFRVVRLSLMASDEVEVDMIEYDSSVYTDSPLTAPRTTPVTNLPDPSVVGMPGSPQITESLYETTGSAGVKSLATISFTAANDAFNAGYLIEYKLAADSTWITLPKITGLEYRLYDVVPGTYNFRVRGENALGFRSDYTSTTTKELLGLTALPAALTNFSVIKSSGFALARWSLSSDLDVRIGGRIVVRHCPLTTGVAWENCIIVGEFNGDAVNGLVPLMTGTYMVKPKDSSDNYATTAVSFVMTEGMVTGFTTIATSTQEPTFSGSKTDTHVVSNELQLDSAVSGSYEFDTYVDLTTSATRRFEADISATSFDTTTMIDSLTELIDTWESIDGAEINDCDATLYAAITDDDPSGSPTWSDWIPFMVADFTCRAAKFKLVLTSGSATHNISVSTLAVDVKEPV